MAGAGRRVRAGPRREAGPRRRPRGHVLCRGGFFTADGWREENLRAIEEAATLGTSVLVLVSGGLPAGSRDVDGARRRVADAIAELAPHAAAAGVTLAIEPLHPMFCADRCVVSTLGQALDIAERFDPGVVGVVVDAYHVWWDDTVYAQIARAGARIAAFQVCDWVTPLPEGVLLGRGLPGDGCIELRRLREAVDAAGYTGPVEVEVFSAEVWARPGREVLTRRSRDTCATSPDDGPGRSGGRPGPGRG